MAIETKLADIDVVTATRERLRTVFENDVEFILSISGGKDSICMAHLVFEAIRMGQVDPKKLTIQFVDEEAMFEDVIEIVRLWRNKFMLEGCRFEWYCVEVKHYNCLNTLTDDETFICWDRFKEDVWVRDLPDFEVIRDDKMLIPRKDNYQSFLTRKNKGKVILQGLRVRESVQRLVNIASLTSNKDNPGGITANGFFFPIYDWEDDDVWRYILENGLDFPETYLHLYQIGVSKQRLRISQFFSIDTAKSLVALNEFDNTLMERIIAREPNAYIASLYWDTEFFRRSKRDTSDGERIDYEKEVYNLYDEDVFETEGQRKIADKYRTLILRNSMVLIEAHWKDIYNALKGGDPKERVYRALIKNIAVDTSNNIKKETIE